MKVIWSNPGYLLKSFLFYVSSLDEFGHKSRREIVREEEEEDDINGIWSASQLASKHAKAKENASKKLLQPSLPQQVGV